MFLVLLGFTFLAFAWLGFVMDGSFDKVTITGKEVKFG
jgi:hypothetical protein